MLTKLLAFFLSVLTAFSSLFGALICIGNTENTDDSFIPVMRFSTTSDTHVTCAGDKACMRIAKALKSAYAYSDNDADYNTLDAVIFNGDLTDTGLTSQFSAFTAAVKGSLREGTAFYASVARNHDCAVLNKDALALYTSLTGNPTDYHTVINGFHFIGLSTSNQENVHYSDEQIAWLDSQIASAVKDDPSKPVFVFQHEHITGTVYGSYEEDGWGVPYFTEVLSKYPQVIDISGHSHYPANDPRAVWQGAFTAINDGGMAYYEFTVDGETSYHPDMYRTMAQILIIEVDAENRVLVKVYDVTAGEFIYEYLIDNVNESVKTEYSHELRAAAAVPPVFAGGSTIKISNAARLYTFTVPQAVAAENDIVFLYRLSIKDSSGKEIYSDKALSEYYFAAVPDTISFKNIQLAKGSYTAEILSEDAWGLAGSALISSFTVR